MSIFSTTGIGQGLGSSAGANSATGQAISSLEKTTNEAIEFQQMVAELATLQTTHHMELSVKQEALNKTADFVHKSLSKSS